jgi:hypothetical protein
MFLYWLRRISSRELYLIFAGLFGLIILASLASQRIEKTARLKREAHERERLARLDQLRQLGIRGVSMDVAATDLFRDIGTWLKVTSSPPDAEVYLDWVQKGTTPLWLSGIHLSGFMVITKDGREAWYQDITDHHHPELSANLSPRASFPSTRLLLVSKTNVSNTTFSLLRDALLEYGFTTAHPDHTAAFERAERASGGLHNRGFRVWARTYCASDFLLRASVQEQSRGLNVQSHALAGTIKVFVDLEFDVYDLTTGEHLRLITAASSAFATHEAQGIRAALTSAVADAAQHLQKTIQSYRGG